MKLKGEKELAIECLYNCVDEELYEITVGQNVLINKIDITDYDNFLDIMYTNTLNNVLYYRIATVLYQMDLSKDEADTLCELSRKHKLLTSLADAITNDLSKINIHNNDKLEKTLKLIITGIMINTTRGN